MLTEKMAKHLEKDSAGSLLRNGSIKTEIKQERDHGDVDDDDDDVTPVFGPAAMGLHRVGEEMPPRPSQPGLALNARGMPARIRKKNRLFYDDDIVTSSPSPRSSPTKRTPKPTPTKKSPRAATSSAKRQKQDQEDVLIKEEPEDDDASGPDRQGGQRTGMRLRNMLKLPKAHKWVCYEWFYSNIDRPLFCDSNDFLVCMEESFPSLTARRLRRAEWCLIRRMMGKPRRCSQAFFSEERGELERKRAKIRLLQQRKVTDTATFQDLPNEIPLQLVIGSKVTARLRKPQDGLFAGCIDAVDTSNNTYRITFDRTGLGTHSIPDYEVLSQDTPETISLASIINKFRPRNITTLAAAANTALVAAGGAVAKQQPADDQDSTRFIGDYTVDLLKWMIRMEKVMELKRNELLLLILLNRQAENYKSQGVALADKFQQRYACAVVRLDEINAVLRDKLRHVRRLLQDVSIAPALIGCASLSPEPFRKRSVTEARVLIETVTIAREERRLPIGSARSRSLMQQCAALLLLVQQMSGNPEHMPCDVKVLQDALDEIRDSVLPANRGVFQDCVEVHMHHVIFQLNKEMPVKHPFKIHVAQ